MLDVDILLSHQIRPLSQAQLDEVMQRIAQLANRPSACFWLILAGSLLLHVLTALFLRPDLKVKQLEADELEYYDAAGEIEQGTSQFVVKRVVGHPLVLAALRGISGDRLVPMQLAVSALASLAAPLAYVLARRELRENSAALLGGLGVMAWPLFLWYSATLYSESVALPLFTAFLLAMPYPSTATNSVRGGRWFAAGLVLGLCMHYRPMYLLYSPFAALLAYWRGRRGWAGMARTAWLAAGCLTLVLPWSVFMSLRHGVPVILSCNGGETLAGGLNPELLRVEHDDLSTPAGRVTWIGPGKWLNPNETGYLNNQELRLPYIKIDRILRERTASWVRSHPGEATYLSMRKLSYMWGLYPFWNGWPQTILGNIPTIILLALGIAALVKLRGCLVALSMLWTPPVFVSIVALISWGSWRFRQPGDVGLILLAAALPFAAQVRAAIASSPWQKQ